MLAQLLRSAPLRVLRGMALCSLKGRTRTCQYLAAALLKRAHATLRNRSDRKVSYDAPVSRRSTMTTRLQLLICISHTKVCL